MAKLDGIKASAFRRNRDVTGECRPVDVKLFNNHPNVERNVLVTTDLVVCNIGRNYQKCASASTDANVIEHYDYTDQECIHTGTMTMS
ncbi:hypothetical protein U1Q18_051534 [Sarracenia purpurea var. burkii]